MPSTLSFRRCQFIAQPPAAGCFIRNRSGKSVLFVKKSVIFRRSGEPPARETIRLTTERLAAADQPESAIILPWPIRESARGAVKPATPQARPVVAFRGAVQAAASTAGNRTRKQRKRDAAKAREIQQIDHDSLVPRAQLDAVIAPDGTVLRDPLAVSGHWRDPADHNRSSRVPKLVYGRLRSDPLVRWARSNREVTAEHIAAADAYRLTYELGPCGAMPAGRTLDYCDRQFSPSSGPAEARCQRMTAWTWVQQQLDGDARRILDAVVLNRVPVTAWAMKCGIDRRRAVRSLIKVLDQLYEIYRDEVDASLKQEGSALD
jgi:hypothetical protein